MNEGKAAAYASALYDLAKAEGKLLDYQAALRDIKTGLLADGELNAVLSSYALPKERLYALCDSVWGKSPLKSLAPFMKTVVKGHAIPYFQEISKAFDSLVNEAEGVLEGLAYSAAPLTEKELAALEKAVGASLDKKVSLTNRVEPSLLGGVKVAVGDKVFDGSLERKLTDLRKKLLEGGSGQ
jgi:F-type H+-transporting ATPase subunit delta